ncbi:ESX secretion-associated protein EspG [Kibdelosporangium philippinense]|uniref:ESX secretion-associated protein EspG n=1 Tax=Kibdelosporangium philippinense TaxID=211113 RepID=A0ABS8ZCS7_9PSEU|nr:ESX secretion-associated protein EspG [Kibdelosporangium philippinense]MCE7005656.1 ESX secretion-associated protein EspG [Kibdelosporangium philippinense]
MPTTFGLSFAAIDILSEGLELNCRVYPFTIPSFGEFADDRVRIAGAIKDDLINRGLADHQGLGPEVTAALRLFNDFQVAIAVMGDVDGGRKVYARGAVTARRGMVVVQDDQLLKFEMIRPEGLARSIAALLPPLNAGPGQSVTVTRPKAHPAPTDDEGGFRQPVARPVQTVNPAQLRGAEEMLRRKRLGSGHFAVLGRDRNGHITQEPNLGWIDTDAGRYLVQSIDSDEVEGGTYFPADSQRMIHQLNELLKSVS